MSCMLFTNYNRVRSHSQICIQWAKWRVTKLKMFEEANHINLDIWGQRPQRGRRGAKSELRRPIAFIVFNSSRRSCCTTRQKSQNIKSRLLMKKLALGGLQRFIKIDTKEWQIVCSLCIPGAVCNRWAYWAVSQLKTSLGEKTKMISPVVQWKRVTDKSSYSMKNASLPVHEKGIKTAMEIYCCLRSQYNTPGSAPDRPW